MNEVNREVLVLKPKEKFLAWVNSSDEEDEVTLDEAVQDSTAYLTRLTSGISNPTNLAGHFGVGQWSTQKHLGLERS